MFNTKPITLNTKLIDLNGNRYLDVTIYRTRGTVPPELKPGGVADKILELLQATCHVNVPVGTTQSTAGAGVNQIVCTTRVPALP